MNIGIIGMGAIGQFLHNTFKKMNSPYQITSVLLREGSTNTFAKEQQIQTYTQLDAFLQSNIDVVIEAATGEVVHDYGIDVVKKKAFIIISVGALANSSFAQRLEQTARESGHRIYLPTGAIAGLDFIQNANALGELQTVQLTTRKPAMSLGKPSIEQAETIFEGRADEAIAQYPKNMNVAVMLAIAGIGFERTKVTLIADPAITKNIHQIDVTGPFGEATLSIQNNALPSNPKTSYLAAMSILGTLQKITSTSYHL